MPSSNTARLAARNRPLAVTMTSVGVTVVRCASAATGLPASTCAAKALQAAAMRACRACGVSVSMRPSASARSMSAASSVACAAAGAVDLAGDSVTGFGAGSADGLARDLSADLGAVFGGILLVLLAILAAAALGDDINSVLLLDHLVLAQLELAVGHAFAGLHVVLVAVPGTDEMHLGVREIHPARGLVRHDPLFDLGDGQALAGRSALMQAEIAVGEELSLVPEHADLVVADKNDASVALLALPAFTHPLSRPP